MTKTITFTDLQGRSQTTTEEKAQQLLAYIAKQIDACKNTIDACAALRDEKGRAEYAAQITALTGVQSQITAALA